MLETLGKTEADLEEGLSINEVVPFFKHFRLQLRVYDEFYRSIFSYDPDVRDRHYASLFCICKNQHVHTCNFNVKALQQYK